MLESLTGAGQVLALFWAVSLVHQFGHYYTGRQIVGVPGDEIRLVNPVIPRYVALRDDDEWVPPRQFQRFRERYERHDPAYEHLERYVASGDIIQVLVVVPAAIALALPGFEGLATTLLLISMALTAVDVVFDAVLTRWTGTLSGDYSALWYVSPRIPALLLIGFYFVHLGAFYFVT